MSKQSVADLKCTSCGNTSELVVYTSINIKLNPELKSKVIDGSIFKHTCKSCGELIASTHEVLYHDPENRFMVWLAEPDDENIIFFQKGSLKIASALENYRLYIARYPFQWIERISTLDQRFDPRIIELYKFSLKDEQEMPLKSSNDFLHFNNITKNIFGIRKMHWKLVFDNGQLDHFSKALNSKKYQAYENLIQNLEPQLKAKSWYLIDWQFPFGIEINDDELIKLPPISDYIEMEIGQKMQKMPIQFLDVLKRTGKGSKNAHD